MKQDRPSVAFVDDEANILHSIKRGLIRRNVGWDLHFFTAPKAFLEAIEQGGAFDVLVSDMRMPEMSGLELVSAVRRDHAIPCLILTGSPDLTSALYAINQADVFRFYTKPCDLDLLVDGIEAALETASVSQHAAIEDGGGLDDKVTKIGLAALDHLSLCIAVVNEDGELVFTNKSAAALFAIGDGLTVCPQNRCRAGTVEQTKTLLALVKQTLDTSYIDTDDINVMAIERPSMKRSYSLFASPLSTDGPPSDKGLVALFISDPETQPVPGIQHIMQLYDLSKSQALIVQNLAMGLRVEEAAEVAGVTVSTARTYLKQVFSKTETSRQSELLKLVLASPRVSAA